MAYTLTNNWDDIQERNIDPFSDVTSDNHNKLLKILGNHKAYIKGFDWSFERDAVNNRMILKLTAGTCVISYMVIEFLEQATIVLFSCPTNAIEYAVVVEYVYSKIQPLPFATIKVIPIQQVVSTKHLVLFTFWTDAWDIVPYMEDWLAWFNANHKDYRNGSDNIPSWAYDTFVQKAGDTMTGPLLLSRNPVDNAEASNKSYVDSRIANHGYLHTGQFLQLAGGTMSGFITLHADPTLAMHAATKQYIDTVVASIAADMDNNYVKISGSVMTGMLRLAADPTHALHAVTKQYADNTFVNVSGDTMTGDLTVNTKITTPNLNAATKMSFQINSVEVGDFRASTGFSSLVALNTPVINHNTIYPIGAPKNYLSFQINQIERAQLTEYGLVGSVFNADMVELFNHNMTQMPKSGACVGIDENGKVVLCDDVNTVLGFISYTPGLILGGTTDWVAEFKNGRVPVALVGQIKNVEVLSNYDYNAGVMLVPIPNSYGKVAPIDINTADPITLKSVIAKSLEPIKKGIGKYRIVIVRG